MWCPVGPPGSTTVSVLAGVDRHGEVVRLADDDRILAAAIYCTLCIALDEDQRGRPNRRFQWGLGRQGQVIALTGGSTIRAGVGVPGAEQNAVAYDKSRTWIEDGVGAAPVAKHVEFHYLPTLPRTGDRVAAGFLVKRVANLDGNTVRVGNAPIVSDDAVKLYVAQVGDRHRGDVYPMAVS